MEQVNSIHEMVSKLQKEIFHLQGIKQPKAGYTQDFGLNAVEKAFPNSVFPTAAIHEFLSTTPENSAATGAFIAGLLKTLMQDGGVCLWISTSRTLFPPSLKTFGIAPDKIVFIDLKREKDVLWATEEALKCEGLAAVIAEVRDISLTQSRRLQLCAEKSRITGMILRNDGNKLAATTCVARWQIKPVASEQKNGMPGLGFPRWQVELLKVRNGNPGSWTIEWSAGCFHTIEKERVASITKKQLLKIG